MSTAITLESLLATVKQRWTQASSITTEHVDAVQAALIKYKEAYQTIGKAQLAKSIGLAVEVPDTESAALHLLDAVEKLPELTGKTALRTREQALPMWPEEMDGDEIVVIKPKYPKLWAATQAQTLTLIGGVPVEQKVDWLRSVVGGNVEWIGTEDDSDSRAYDRLANQMRGSSVAAVIFFAAFCSHNQTDALFAASRATGVPIVDGGRAGQGALLAAMDSLETNWAA